MQLQWLGKDQKFMGKWRRLGEVGFSDYYSEKKKTPSPEALSERNRAAVPRLRLIFHQFILILKFLIILMDFQADDEATLIKHLSIYGLILSGIQLYVSYSKIKKNRDLIK